MLRTLLRSSAHPVIRSAVLLLLLFAAPAHAGLIRDAEIERHIRDLATPIWEAAELDPAAVRILILADPSINAYVAGGQNIFIHTGLLEAATTPEMLIGVIAHETGHIAGGHLARGTEKMKDASLGTLISFVLGAAAAVGGQGDVGSAIITGGPSVAQRSLLSFSRANEQSADQAGLHFLDVANVTPQGMLDMFTRLRRDERRFGSVDPYTLTHPLTTERIATVRAAVDQSAKKGDVYPEAVQERHRRVLAKVQGFLDPPRQVISQRLNDNSVAGHYATAIAYFRLSQIADALKLMDQLIKAEPEDGWFHELKGQMLFENGRIPEAREEYRKATLERPAEPQIRTEYAKTLLADQTDPKTLDQAVALLRRSSEQDATYAETWRLLADAYGRQGADGEAHLALAEEAALGDDQETVRSQSDLALKALTRGTPAYLRGQDLRNLAIRIAREKREAGESPSKGRDG